MTRKLIPVAFGVTLAAVLAGVGTTVGMVFAVKADTQVIRTEVMYQNKDIQRHENDIADLEDRLLALEID